MQGLGSAPKALAYSVNGAADVLSISPRQVWRHLAAGNLTAIKAGHRTLIRRAELIRYLRSLPAYEPPGAA